MKVVLNTHGGLAAGVHRPPLVVDSIELSETAASELQRLVNAAKSSPPADKQSGIGPDEMSYTISIEDHEGITHSIRRTDTEMTPQVAALIDWLEEHKAGN